MKFHTAALQFLVASEALRFGVRAQSVVVDRMSNTNVADAAVSDVLLETPADSGGRFSADGSSSKTGTTYHTVADAGVSDVLLETPADSGRFFPNGINNLRVVDSVTRGDGSSSKTGTTYHTVADAAVSDVLLETPADSGGRFFPSDINNNLYHTVVDSVTRGDESSFKTSTMHHTVADAGVSDVLLETPVDSGGSLVPPSRIVNHHAVVDAINDDDEISSAPNDVVNLYLHAVVDAINDDDEISSFTGSDGDTISIQRKLSKSSKKVKHLEALCTLSLFADSLFMYANQCFNDIMVTISPCDDKDDTCYISEQLPSVPQDEQEEQEENQEEEQCFVGGSFPAKQNIRYNPLTGDCEFLYVDLTDDPCNSYIGDTGTGSLGLKARINVKNNPDVMFIQFTKDKGLTFYNVGDERVAKRSNDRYLRQEGATKPVLSMMPHPFPSSHRRLYDRAFVKNDTPFDVHYIRFKYNQGPLAGCCNPDWNFFVGTGDTWQVQTERGICLITDIIVDLWIDGRAHRCSDYSSSGTGIASFYIMWIDGECCTRSWKQDADKCP